MTGIREVWDNEVLDDNTCWMYQLALERMIRRYLPDPKMHGGAVEMIRLLGQQARRANPPRG